MLNRTCDICGNQCSNKGKLEYEKGQTLLDLGRSDQGKNKPGICCSLVMDSDTKGATAELCGSCFAIQANIFIDRFMSERA